MALKSFFDLKNNTKKSNFEKTLKPSTKNCSNLLDLVNENNKIFVNTNILLKSINK
jgi:hypothetical protein